ncbi:hypothetical protein P154DRAFT_400398, partial [Amniculicola lignicola CBS 123094]
RPINSKARPEQHAKDFAKYRRIHAKVGQYGHKSARNNCNDGYRAKIAHARLIHSIFGTLARTPYSPCAKEGMECCVYDPELQTKRRQTSTCGN